MADMVKMEDGVPLKTEPDTNGPSAVVDDYDYEDTGELEIPKEPLQAWLVRLPKQLYDKWATIADDQPIQLGHVRQFKNSDKFQLHLNPSLPQSQGLSKRYDMRTMGQDVRNTFVFSEKDLPGFKSKGKQKNTFGGTRAGNAMGTQGKVDKNWRYQGYTRRAIPKQTALAGIINKEVTCIPIDIELEPRQQRLDVERGKGGMTILKGDVRKFARMIIEPETGRPVRPRANFDNFKMDASATKAKTQENKTARIPQNELLDKLYECFTKYRYWSMTAFRQALHQPESYLRSTLPLIADQVRSGPFNNHWKLKPEAEPANLEFAATEESAPQRDGDVEGDNDGVSSAVDSPLGEDEDEEDDDNEDDLQMEDVGL